MPLYRYIRFQFIALLISFAFGVFCQFMYNYSPGHSVHIDQFNAELHIKELNANSTLNKLREIIIHSSVDSLARYPFNPDDEIEYIVYQDGEPVFWSDNHIDVRNQVIGKFDNLRFLKLPNAYCVTTQQTLDNLNIVAYINIKNNYPYENDKLVNRFAVGFSLDKHVEIVAGKPADRFAVRSVNGEYLFSLHESATPVYDERWAILGLISFIISFAIIFVLYAGSHRIMKVKTMNLKTFMVISISVGVFIVLSLYFNIPELIYRNKLFTPLQYASNNLLASISHLTIATGYLISTIYLFAFHVNLGRSKGNIKPFLLLFSYAIYFLMLFFILNGLVFHSSLQLSILRFNDFSAISLWIHFLILIWGIGLALLFFKIHNWIRIYCGFKKMVVYELLITALMLVFLIVFWPTIYIKILISFPVITFAFYLPYLLHKNKKILIYISIWAFIYAFFVIWNTAVLNREKNESKYHLLAQNILINGNNENDRMADILLEELDKQIVNDRRVALLLKNPDSIQTANSYLNQTYLRGFWNKYEMRLNLAAQNSELFHQYSDFMQRVGTKLKDTHFFSVPATYNDMSYLGVFPAKVTDNDTSYFYMQFYPRKKFRSYSFPDLFVTSTADIQSQLDISIAKYDYNNLVYSSGIIEFPVDRSWIPQRKSEFFTVFFQNRWYYVYYPDYKTQIVITEQHPRGFTSYLVYFAYVFLAFFAFSWLFTRIVMLLRHSRTYKPGLTAKFQFAFITLLIISFFGIFYVSVNFIQKKYREQQIANIENKKNYIQKALQDMYYWSQDLSTVSRQGLNFDLQELSYVYQTDIHVYDNRGRLVGSSQPLIFSKNLMSEFISPTPYFSPRPDFNQYEHIGGLRYLTAYTDFYNGDYLQIGYIAVPQFYSQSEISSEIESFLSVIIHIYLIIIVLAILLSLFIGKQLSLPLNMLESKLKQMRFGHRNEKIDYDLNDEIGQLVAQYNKTVDELEKSARLLAQSERETAWKTMARQIAHEINNPLTPMKLTIQQLQRTYSIKDERFDDYFKKSTSTLIEQIDNLSRIAGTFSNFARMPEAQFVRVDVAARLHSAVQLFAHNNEQIEIRFYGEESGLFVFADPEQLVQVFNNLLKNAIQSIPADRDGKILVKIVPEENQIVISVSDNGCGISVEIADKLFMPNFTTKNTGMGLGLTISKNIIEMSGGNISFVTDENKGTTFVISLPQEK